MPATKIRSSQTKQSDGKSVQFASDYSSEEIALAAHFSHARALTNDRSQSTQSDKILAQLEATDCPVSLAGPRQEQLFLILARCLTLRQKELYKRRFFTLTTRRDGWSIALPI